MGGGRRKGTTNNRRPSKKRRDNKHEAWLKKYLRLTVLDKYLQSLGVAIFSSDPQRRHPVTVRGRHFGSVSEQQVQDGGTALLFWERNQDF